MRRSVIATLAVATLALAGCGSVSVSQKAATTTVPPLVVTVPPTLVPITSTLPPPTTAAPTTTVSTVPTTTAAPKPALVITISGSGPSSDITLDINNQETQHTGSVALPVSYTDANYVSEGFGVGVEAQDGSGSGSATITCTVTEAGVQVTSNTATGPYSIASCEAAS